MTQLFHLTERATWLAAGPGGEYRMSTRGATLAEAGFIHCSLRHQLRQVAELWYQDVDDLVILVIDQALVPAPVRYEAAAPGAEEYPHIYGPVPVAAVTEVVTVGRDETGSFVLPE
jgi:uncharacterized protein (DUF952 family)